MAKTTSAHESGTVSIPGYDYGRPTAAHSPVSLDELRQIEMSAGWSDEDAAVLQRNAEIFRNYSEQMVDSWRSVIASQPHLAKWFFRPDGKPDDEYKAKVKKRFVQWVQYVCTRPHDQAWLDYQGEIGLRHTPAKKNRTDDAGTPELVPLRYLIAFGSVVSLTARRFFMEAGVREPELRKLEDAWSKAVQLHISLWARPYTQEGLW